MFTRLYFWLAAWTREMRFRFDYNAGSDFALHLLKRGWPPADVRALPSFAPECMPSDAYRTGFNDALLEEARHAA